MSADVNCAQSRDEAVEKLRMNKTMENLWGCILEYQGYPFYTMTGLPFSYTLKKGRNGIQTRELCIDRRAESKSLVYSSIARAFEAGCRLQGQIVERPKALGDIRGISYIYPIFAQIGLIQIPENVRIKMKL